MPAVPSNWIIVHKNDFVVIWFVVFGIRCATIMTLLLYVWYFHWLSQDTGFQDQWRKTVHTMGTKAIANIMLFFSSILLSHGYHFVQMLYATFAERKLVFRRTKSIHVVPHQLPNHQQQSEQSNLSTKMRTYSTTASLATRKFTAQTVVTMTRVSKEVMLLRVVWRMIQRIARFVAICFGYLLNFFGLFGIRSKWFNQVFAIRETIELITQSIQTYRMQCLIANDTLNGIAVTTLFLSSISTGSIEMWTKERTEKSIKTRLALMMADACLDFVFAVGLPLGCQLTMLPDLDFARMSFHDDKLNDDVWYTGAVRQFQQFSLSSNWDVVSTIVFQTGLLYCLMKVQGMVNRQDQVQAENLYEEEKVDNDPEEDATAEASHHHVPVSHRSKSKLIQNKVFHLLPYAHALIGVLATSASIFARLATSSPINGCRLSGYEWFKGHPVCITMEINCYKRDIRGHTDEVNAVLLEMDTKWLFALSFTHCQELEIPESIQELHNLYMLDTYNSTVVRWSRTSALTKTTNPQVTHLRFFRTTFLDGTLPEGLVAADSPSTLNGIVIVNTNLRVIPPEAALSWNSITYIYLDHNPLGDFPPALTHFRTLSSVSMVNASITNISDGLLDEMRFQRLILAGNPLTRLPSQIGTAQVFKGCTLSLEHTKVEALPLWAEDFMKRIADQKSSSCQTSLYDTPICSNRFTRELVAANESLLSIDWFASRCINDLETARGWTGIQYADKAKGLQA